MYSTRSKAAAYFCVFLLLNQIFVPVQLFALTGGPSQPEVHGFEPVGTNQMVDLFSGDFTYNIPLLDVGGYPINMAYHSGVGLEQEASWVGLGWSLTPGSINRSMRGLPDDFKGDQIRVEQHLKDNISYGVSRNYATELIGIELPINVNLGVHYNSYKGVGYSTTFSTGMDFGPFNANASLGVSTDKGANANLSFAYKKEVAENDFSFNANGAKSSNAQSTLSGGLNIGLNSSEGLNRVSFSASHNSSYSEWGLDFQSGDISSSNKRTSSLGMQANIPLNFHSYTPTIGTSMYNKNFSFDLTVGAEVFGAHPALNLAGFYTKQELAFPSKATDAYGYLYHHAGQGRSGDVLLDFNREGDIPFTDQNPHIQRTNLTYDAFNISGQGTGGMFRPYRSDIPMTGDPKGFNRTRVNHSLSLEFGGGNLWRIGANYTKAGAENHNGFWKSDEGNTLVGKAGALSYNRADPHFEHVYMRSAGELTPIDSIIFQNRGGYDAVEVGQATKDESWFSKKEFHPNNKLVKENGDELTIDVQSTASNREHIRQARGTSISWLTNKEASAGGFMKSNATYSKFKEGNNYSALVKNRENNPKHDGERLLDKTRKGHHFGEFSVTRPDGMRYVYGIPAYNHIQHTVAFTINEEIGECASGQTVSYTSTNASVNNTAGRDNFYNKRSVPAYAHSYLLTAVLSPDYVDVTGDGISLDDYGTAVKFNYKKVVDTFKWRSPLGDHKANYQDGFASLNDDQKGNYTYGEKEIWYVHSIESKTHIAEFYTSVRDDAAGVEDEFGKIDTVSANRQQKLDSILLFNKYDRIDNKNWNGRGTEDEPIKKVYFKYDYSLCNGVPNNVNSGGKLTLKSVHFSYGWSRKGLLSPYEFTYDYNPDYRSGDNDRWGNYLRSSCAAPNINFPYTRQKDSTDQFAYAWHLTDIKLPSGGRIEVDYEADDYAYVMEKDAMEMVQLAGIGNSKDFNGELADLNNTVYTNGKYNEYLYFPLRTSVNNNAELKRLYWPENGILQHKCKVYIKNNGEYEYINGYTNIEDMGLVPGNSDYGYIKMEPDTIWGGAKVSPIAKNAWAFIHGNLSEKIYEKDVNPETPVDAVKVLGAAYKDIISMIKGKYKRMRSDGFARKIDLSKSFIRLRSPDGQKKGGGSRVKQVRMIDNWANQTSGEASSTYGMVYDYGMPNPDATSPIDSISSGVAAYEPHIGAEENPYKQPLYYNFFKKPQLKLGKESKYIEGPIGESFFPGASVGYSRITVRSLASAQNEGTGTGYNVNEFYTTKDFPVKVEMTSMIPEKIVKGKNILKFLMNVYNDRHFATQGFVVKTNNMAGKQKAVWAYDKYGERISGTQYNYNVKEGVEDELDNTIKVLNKDGHVEEKIIGQMDDIVIDTRYSQNESWQANIGTNLDFFMIGPVPIPIPSGFTPYKSQKNSLKSLSVTKVIQQYGILKSTEAYDEQSKVVTKNMLWDAVSGEVLLTKTENEFRDGLFNMKYPAYFAYDNMGAAYQNDGLILKDKIIDHGVISFNSNDSADNYFALGDHLLMELNDYTTNISGGTVDTAKKVVHGWVKGIKGHQAYIINRDGAPVLGEFTSVRVLESGRTNQLDEIAYSYTARSQPRLNVWSQNTIDDPDTLLQVNAVEFSDKWGTYCDETEVRRCSLNSVGYGIMHVLNAAARETGSYIHNGDTFLNYPSWFALVDSGDYETYSTQFDTISFYFGDDEEYQQTALKSLNDTSYFKEIKCVSTGCSTSTGSVKDTFFIYTFYTVDGVRTVFKSRGELPESSLDHYDRWTLNYSIVNRDTGCCSIDTLLSERLRYKKFSSVELNTWHFDMSFVATHEIQCGIKLTNYKAENVTLSDIDSFSNIRLNPAVDDDYHFLIDVHVSDTFYTLHGSSEGCYNIRDCWKDCDIKALADINETDTINPYVRSMRGIWRQKSKSIYHTERFSTSRDNSGVDNTDIRRDGGFAYLPFWVFSGDEYVKNPSLSSNWVSPSSLVHYSPHGNPLESVDALGRYSCEIYGYDRKVVVATANNARHNNIAYQGFEDVDFPYYDECKKSAHWAFMEDATLEYLPAVKMASEPYVNYNPLDSITQIREDQSHTGRASLYVPSGSEHESTERIYNGDSSNHNTQILEVFRVDQQMCIGKFAPERGKKYIISAWINESDSNSTLYSANYDSGRVVVKSDDGALNKTFFASGPIIDGWQRIYGQFSIPSDTGIHQITIKAKAGQIGGQGVYFDDIRIQPFNSLLKSYVYDPVSLRVIAELDENNFATYYEYDEEGRLTRIKKETERGIVTLQESRYTIPK